MPAMGADVNFMMHIYTENDGYHVSSITAAYPLYQYGYYAPVRIFIYENL